MATKKVNKKKDIKIAHGVFHVKTTENNTIVTLTDLQWNKVIWWWTGTQGFKWAKQSTPYASEMVAKHILKEGVRCWLNKVGVIFRGNWLWREWVFKAFNEIWSVEIEYIKDETPIQFGGCRWIRPKRM